VLCARENSGTLYGSLLIVNGRQGRNVNQSIAVINAVMQVIEKERRGKKLVEFNYKVAKLES